MGCPRGADAAAHGGGCCGSSVPVPLLLLCSAGAAERRSTAGHGVGRFEVSPKLGYFTVKLPTPDTRGCRSTEIRRGTRGDPSQRVRERSKYEPGTMVADAPAPRLIILAIGERSNGRRPKLSWELSFGRRELKGP